jgi:LmbE family N-acetylglucosaminyl deacetylase
MDGLAIRGSGEPVIKLRPAVEGGLRIVCLGAHPDDIEIGAGGTILRLVGEGSVRSVRWVVLSGTEDRATEARRAADRFLEGVEERAVTVEGFRDGHFPDAWGQIKETLEGVAQAGPADLVLTPRRDDWHQDHRLIGQLVWTVFRDQLILEYEIPKWDGDLATPNLYVDLPGWAVERKSRLLVESFPSQAGRSWFAPETFEALARLRGVEARASEGFAEGFHARKVAI